MMRVYNTASRRVEDFKPIEKGQVGLYTCGPTVYDYAQIGNLRAFVFDDTLRRVLNVAGFDVKHVMNITDVGHLASDEDEGEDKLEKGASRENKSVWEVAEFYIGAFLKDVKALNILEPNGYHGPHGVYARATDFIEDQIKLVRILIEKNYAYQTEQAIYFDVSKLSDYGQLSGQKLADKEVGARAEVVTDDDKRNPQDFALWFFTVGRFEDHSMRWPSPWGDGFPGWHLECSAIIHAVLGEPIDIHTGGVDHIGTHHTNEIAQTEAAFDVRLANYWMHNEHLLVDGQKMSKSKGNFYTLADITDKGFGPLALRLLFLQSHYRSQTNFGWEGLEAAAKKLSDLRALADLRFQAQPGAAALKDDYLKQKQTAIFDDLSNDLATPAALAEIEEAADHIMTMGIRPESLKDFESFLMFLDDALGLGLLDSEDITEEQKRLIEQREDARQRSDWPAADACRQRLLSVGLEINDTPLGPVWRRT
jgi:cysteinyl-tRNA synthetase